MTAKNHLPHSFPIPNPQSPIPNPQSPIPNPSNRRSDRGSVSAIAPINP
ncbi:hypothetical protein JYQ62_04120 [Nostoc sp. UHCC 0702]|nr:hypothetical protein JYQ62_04120 [Nostoc sp. UHCC 0702]